jgi:hypothetical protein
MQLRNAEYKLYPGNPGPVCPIGREPRVLFKLLALMFNSFEIKYLYKMFDKGIFLRPLTSVA